VKGARRTVRRTVFSPERAEPRDGSAWRFDRRPFGHGLTVESLLRLIGLDWAVPDFSTLSRRQETLKVNIPCRGSDGPLHLLVDSTGIKVEGEGEWTEEGQQTVRVRAKAIDPGDQLTCEAVCATTAQAWRHETARATVSRTGGETVARLAQDPHRDRRE
jgi:hypothetical protein